MKSRLKPKYIKPGPGWEQICNGIYEHTSGLRIYFFSSTVIQSELGLEPDYIFDILEI